MSLGRTIHDFEVRTIDGEHQSLARYRGQVTLIVNTASRCGFTPQYQGIETLYQRYRERGFVVLGFPANDFLRQEPGSEAEIATFCSTQFGVTFPPFAKIHVKGPEIHPLYAHLTQHPAGGGPIDWNFAKILADRDGRVLGRFPPRVDPLAKAVTAAIERALAAPPRPAPSQMPAST